MGAPAKPYLVRAQRLVHKPEAGPAARPAPQAAFLKSDLLDLGRFFSESESQSLGVSGLGRAGAKQPETLVIESGS